ncbi:hypothetical protein DSL92_06255 [Billgrantia gudaonensis]|uniref:NIDO domain-containing protein n=1 Tax=Billgrantia gudaonensis TaxID=376427 RepID=A0A432JJ08_9GAMM|nr:hypothetical protein DSL92_06255 [Halomonas gudaonensis]
MPTAAPSPLPGGYYSYANDKLNAFQLQLVDAGNGNFDIVFRYEDINWTTGDASGANNGLGGRRSACWLLGRRRSELLRALLLGNQNFMLGLEDTVLAGSDEPGVWNFPCGPARFSASARRSDDSAAAMATTSWMAAAATTRFTGCRRRHHRRRRRRDDLLYGESGNNIPIGGPGENQLFGGSGKTQRYTPASATPSISAAAIMAISTTWWLATTSAIGSTASTPRFRRWPHERRLCRRSP